MNRWDSMFCDRAVPRLAMDREEDVIRRIMGSWAPPGLSPESPALAKPSMRHEANRLQSFTLWPSGVPVIPPVELVRAGFYYLGPGDRVQCFCCGVVLKNWEPGDRPHAEHRKFYPGCPFMRGEDVGNVARLGGSDSVDGQILGQFQRFPGGQEEEDEDTWQPAYPEMLEERERLATYRDWPLNAQVTPDLLTRAGFFYTDFTAATYLCAAIDFHGQRSREDLHAKLCEQALGIDFGTLTYGTSKHLYAWSVDSSPANSWHSHPWHATCRQRDNVKCFYCDGRLRNWERGDDPWREHAKWFPRCEFLVRSMGQAYIRGVHDSCVSNPDTTPDHPHVSVRGSASLIGSPCDWQSCLQSSVVQGALQMGFDRDLVLSLVQSRQQLTGTIYSSVSDLVTDLVQAAEEPSPPRAEPVRIPEAPEQRQDPEAMRHKDPEPPLSTEEQLRQLKEERMCKVCMDKDVSMVFVPCGHLVVCTDCAPNLRHCPICRAVIRSSVRAFMS